MNLIGTSIQYFPAVKQGRLIDSETNIATMPGYPIAGMIIQDLNSLAGDVSEEANSLFLCNVILFADSLNPATRMRVPIRGKHFVAEDLGEESACWQFVPHRSSATFALPNFKNFISFLAPISPWGHTQPAILHIPKDLPLPNGRFPIAFFHHGAGERGTDGWALVNQGLPQVVEQNGSVYGIEPVTGQRVNIAVFAAQDQYWSPDPANLKYIIPFLEKTYPGTFDWNFSLGTGLSAGGQALANTLGIPANVGSFATVAAMSVADYAVGNYAGVVDNKIKTWFFTGDSDGGFTKNTKQLYADMNKVLPGSSKLLIYSGGHSGWNTYYDPAWKDLSGESLYDWMLKNPKGGTMQTTTTLPVTTTQPQTTLPAPTTLPARKLVAQLYDDMKWEKL